MDSIEWGELPKEGGSIFGSGGDDKIWVRFWGGGGGFFLASLEEVLFLGVERRHSRDHSHVMGTFKVNIKVDMG